MTGINTAAKLIQQSNQDAPKEALLAEIAQERRGRVTGQTVNTAVKKQPAHDLTEFYWNEPAKTATSS